MLTSRQKKRNKKNHANDAKEAERSKDTGESQENPGANRTVEALQVGLELPTKFSHPGNASLEKEISDLKRESAGRNNMHINEAYLLFRSAKIP